MAKTKDSIASLLEWYRVSVRPFVEEVAPSDLNQLDAQAARLERRANTAEDDVAVCFLGAAGVGKSTLLNAVVDAKHSLLPHGGVGPLTAQATVLRYASQPYFEVKYFGAQTLANVRLTLEAAHERALARIDEVHAADDIAMSMTEESGRKTESESAIAAETPDTAPSGPSEGVEMHQRQLKLLVTGHQHGELDLPYLLGCRSRIAAHLRMSAARPNHAASFTGFAS